MFNQLFTLRCSLKYLTETTTEEQLIDHIETKSVNNNNLEDLLGALVGILVDVPVKDCTYPIHHEAVTCLLVLLSVQMHSGRRADQSTIYRHMIKGKHAIHAPILMKSLLLNYIDQKKPSPGFMGNQSHSVVLGLAADLWSMLTFSRKSTDELVVLEHGDFQETPLATQSLLLILVLVHHCTAQNNPYRLSLASCINNQGIFNFKIIDKNLHLYHRIVQSCVCNQLLLRKMRF